MNKKLVNIGLWILQIALAFYLISGGVYMMGNYKMLASAWALNVIPTFAWRALGVVQILLAFGLVFRKFTFVAAIGLTVISLFGIGLYASYTGAGAIWAVLPAVLLSVVGMGRREK